MHVLIKNNSYLPLYFKLLGKLNENKINQV